VRRKAYHGIGARSIAVATPPSNRRRRDGESRPAPETEPGHQRLAATSIALTQKPNSVEALAYFGVVPNDGAVVVRAIDATVPEHVPVTGVGVRRTARAPPPRDSH
jgi:hypothetical protein